MSKKSVLIKGKDENCCTLVCFQNIQWIDFKEKECDIFFPGVSKTIHFDNLDDQLRFWKKALKCVD